jgi:hypothetical protein
MNRSQPHRPDHLHVHRACVEPALGPRRSAHSRDKCAVLRELLERHGKRRRRAGWHQRAAFAVDDVPAVAGDVGRDHRATGGHRLEDGHGHALAVARKHEHRARGQRRTHILERPEALDHPARDPLGKLGHRHCRRDRVDHAGDARAGVLDEVDDPSSRKGRPAIDTLLANLDRLRAPAFLDAERLERGRYLVLTLHRPSNVEPAAGLSLLLQEIERAALGERVVFPVHPRTARTLRDIGPVPPGLLLVDPQPYLEFNYLVRHARAVITYSGGVTEETTVMGVPCMTLRTTTERPETVTIGTNELLGTDPSAIAPAIERVHAGGWKRGGVPPLWDGQAGRRIVGVMERVLGGH